MEGRRSFHEKLDELNLDMVRMANLTLEALQRTRAAFDSMDMELARVLIEGDDEIDSYVLKVEEKSIELLALQAPVAIDLRTIIAFIRLAQEWERAADNCVNIGKAIINMQNVEMSPWIKENLDKMFDRVESILLGAIDAFIKRDSSRVEELVKMDDTVDRLNHMFLTSYTGDSEEAIDLAIRVVMIARFLERIADHAVNIAEEVHYMVTGQFVD